MVLTMRAAHTPSRLWNIQRNHRKTLSMIYIWWHQDERCKKDHSSRNSWILNAIWQQHILTNNSCSDKVPKSHPQIAITAPHIVINNSNITRHIIQQLQQVATIPAYHQYLAKRYTWPRHLQGSLHGQSSPLHLIGSHKMKNKSFRSSFMDGFHYIHDHKLQAHQLTNYVHPSFGNPKTKNISYMWYIPWKTIFAKLHSNIQQLSIKHNMDTLLYQILWQGITSVMSPHELPDPTTCYPQKDVNLFYHQHSIR